jgi:3-deoxy-D-arabino-heptulosonate 7-phosphate (DAHP) synthase class II
MLSPSMPVTAQSPLTPAQASTYLQRSVFLPHPHLARRPAVRITGQYSKPRSYPYEQIGDHQVLCLGACSVPRPPATLMFKKRGNIVNTIDPNDRTPDPKRLLRSMPRCLSESLVSSLICHSAYFHPTWAAVASL